MKNLLHLLFIILLIAACSPGKREEASVPADSTAAGIASQDCKMFKADSAAIPGIVRDFLQQEEANKDSYYALELHTEGYEYRTDATWYFDSSFRLRYYIEDWVSEALGGTSQYVFCNDNLHAFYEITGHDGTQDIAQAYRTIGFMYTVAEGDTVVQDRQVIESQLIVSRQVELVKKLDQLLKRLATDATTDGSSKVIQSSEEVSYGEDFNVTETFTCRLDTAAYRALIK